MEWLRNFIKTRKEKKQMNKIKENFRDTMYDYSNIIEYYSFYGKVIYVSTDVTIDSDYFIILKNGEKYACVKIESEEHNRFLEFKNRDSLIEELDKLEQNIKYVTGYAPFLQSLSANLESLGWKNKSRNELLKIKTSEDTILWFTILIDSFININKIPKTMGTQPIEPFTRPLNTKLFSSTIFANNLYYTRFNVKFDTASGVDFMDIELVVDYHKYTRRLYFYDIVELDTLLKVMARGVRMEIDKAVKVFTSV